MGCVGWDGGWVVGYFSSWRDVVGFVWCVGFVV